LLETPYHTETREDKDVDYWDSSTVPFQGVYGPSGGQGNGSTEAQLSPSGLGKGTYFGLELPTLIALGVVTWWVIKKLD
jgi:hypothetical protein